MKVAIVYSTTTGNTEAMANAIKDSVLSNGVEIVFGTPENVDSSSVLECDVLLLGSPAMGDEVLEDSMEDWFVGIEGSLNGKKIAVFGSYDWGDGQWLRDWEERIKNDGGVITTENLKINLTPDDAGITECKEWASKAIK